MDVKTDTVKVNDAKANDVKANDEKEDIMKAVMAMKERQAEKDTVYIQTGTQWKETLHKLETEIEKELEKVNAAVADVIAKEKEKCRADLEKAYAQKHKDEITALKEEHEKTINAMNEEHKSAVEALKSEHHAQMEKTKKQYEQQLSEVTENCRDKNQQLRRDIDQYKEQIEMLMLNIDDPFVLQEMQMKQDQEAKQARSHTEAAEAAQQTEEQ